MGCGTGCVQMAKSINLDKNTAMFNSESVLIHTNLVFSTALYGYAKKYSADNVVTRVQSHLTHTDVTQDMKIFREGHIHLSLYSKVECVIANVENS